jgi:hypothetical protein
MIAGASVRHRAAESYFFIAADLRQWPVVIAFLLHRPLARRRHGVLFRTQSPRREHAHNGDHRAVEALTILTEQIGRHCQHCSGPDREA